VTGPAAAGRSPASGTEPRGGRAARCPMGGAGTGRGATDPVGIGGVRQDLNRMRGGGVARVSGVRCAATRSES
jgi:hypothetical protein